MRETGTLEQSGPLTLGTAGHVDHGKTTLIGALTGTNTDRLPEEKARGMSIDLGYAELALPSGRHLSIVDVPGHERFVRTMVAGATGIDCYLMVIAADEGVRQQTREHARILRSLNVTTGVVAVTKTDLRDPRAAIEQAAQLMPDADVIACSAHSNTGITALTAALDRATAHLRSRASGDGPMVMHIDRSFTIKGSGTVATGTLSSGSVAAGETLILHPSGIEARVRSVEVHGRAREHALAGERVALNLARVPRSRVSRGDVIAAHGAVTASHILDVQLDFEPTLAQRQVGSWRVQAHHGTRSTQARLVPLRQDRLAQLLCQAPLLARAGERLVIREAARRDTLGGAIIINPLARRHRNSGTPTEAVVTLLADEQPLLAVDAEPSTPAAPSRINQPDAHVPLSPSAIALEGLIGDRWFRPIPDRLLDSHDPGDLAQLRASGRIVRLTHDRHAHVAAVSAAESRLTAIIRADGSISLPTLRDELGVSRADTKAFLDYFDNTRLTRRHADDTRTLRRSSPTRRSVGRT
jgi:selenocysteine-specific elongation factor